MRVRGLERVERRAVGLDEAAELVDHPAVDVRELLEAVDALHERLGGEGARLEELGRVGGVGEVRGHLAGVQGLERAGELLDGATALDLPRGTATPGRAARRGCA